MASQGYGACKQPEAAVAKALIRWGRPGTFRQRTEFTKRQRDILHALHIDAPTRIYQLKPAVEQSEP